MSFISKLLKPKMPTIVMPPTPEVQAPAPMPDTNSAEVQRAKTQEIRRRMQRGGRQSTIMSQGSDDFSSSTLG